MLTSYCKNRKCKKCDGAGGKCEHSCHSKGQTRDEEGKIKPAPKDGPELYIRMRSASSLERVRKAARKAGLSMNTWVVEVLDKSSQMSLQA